MELYRNELGTVTVTLPSSVNVVSAELIKDGNAVALVGATITDGVASVEIPFNYVTEDQEFDVRFNFAVGTVSTSYTEHVEVVTGILSRARAEKISAGRYDEIEPVVRGIIQSFTGQKFGKWTGTKYISGNGESALELPERLLSLTGLTRGGTVLGLDQYFTKGDNWYLTKWTGDGLTVKEAPPEESLEVHIPFGQTIFYPFGGSRRGFRNDVAFGVTGTWGYESIPMDVQRAAELLFDDYTCPEAVYRNRYVNDVSAQSWKLKFDSRAFESTGNVLADQLLGQYVRIRMFML